MSREPKPWELSGSSSAPLRSVDQALARLHTAERRAPTDADRPPPQAFPMTRGAREALRLGRASR